MNDQLECVNVWLSANKLSLNTEKTSFVIFHPPQKKLGCDIWVFKNDKLVKQDFAIKYLGIVVNCHLNWKTHVSAICKKIKRNIGAISKLPHFIDINVLTSLYYSLIYHFLLMH